MTRHSRLVIALALVTFVIGCSEKPDPPLKSREVTGLSNDQQTKETGDDFLDGDLKVYKQVRAIPEDCRYAYAGADVDNVLFMADPGRKYQGSEKKPDAKDPRQRLIFAGSNPHTCFVYYEQEGSAGVKYHLEIFYLGPPATLMYHGIDSKDIYKDLAALRMAVRGRAFMRMAGSERFDR
jgi:hypothetical protein